MRFVPLRLNKFMAEDELDAAKHKCPTCEIMYDMNERWVHGACEVRWVLSWLVWQLLKDIQCRPRRWQNL